MELHRIRLAGQPQTAADQRQGADDPHPAAQLPLAAVHPLVQMPPFERQRVLRPQPLDVDQHRLPLAEQEVLQGGEREEVFLGDHGALRASRAR
jgi:hypothetical protein